MQKQNHPVRNTATLIIFGGLPGTGKTTLARMLSRELDATYLRIDTIEQAIRDSQRLAGAVEDAGYRVAYSVAADNLLLGRTVVADSVNPIQITRDAWRAVASNAGAQSIEIEVICTDTKEHRHRVETRNTDIPGLSPPTWRDVSQRGYDPWDRERIVINTAKTSPDQAFSALKSMLANVARQSV